MQDVIDYISPYLDQLTLEEVLSPLEAARRASTFLGVLAHLNNFKWRYSQKEVESKSVRDATLAEIQAAVEEEAARENKKLTVDKMKAKVESSAEYIEARESAELSKAAVGIINNYVALFTNAHIFYRSLAKDSEE